MAGEYYHIYNRGTEKRDIFLRDNDYQRFLSLLYLCNSDNPADLKIQGSTLEEACAILRGEQYVDLCAYVLMPNHFHLIIRGVQDNGISKFMQKLSTGYTMYFNTRQERTGSLFQGRFKARHVNRDSQLSYLIAYVHLNPIKLVFRDWQESGIPDKNRAEEFLKNYRWSSYHDYRGTDRLEKILLNKSALPEYFKSPREFNEFLNEWIEIKSTQGSTLYSENNPSTQKALV